MGQGPHALGEAAQFILWNVADRHLKISCGHLFSRFLNLADWLGEGFCDINGKCDRQCQSQCSYGDQKYQGRGLGLGGLRIVLGRDRSGTRINFAH